MTSTGATSDDRRSADRPGRWAARLTSPAVWPAAGVLLLLWAALFTPWGRPLMFDEAVFLSQSGGLEGAAAQRWSLAASREHGTYTLGRVVRVFAESLGSIEMLWAVVMVAAVVVAFALAARQVGRAAALVGLLAFGTTWVSVVGMSAIFGSLGSAAAALTATALYLELRRNPAGWLWSGLGFGVALAAACWMRTLEPILAGAVIVAHAVVWRPRELLQRWRGVAVAVGAFVVTFVLPWIAVTVHRWGSLGAWWTQSRHQGEGSGRQGFPIALYNGVDDYARLLVGRAGAGPSGRPPAGKYLDDTPAAVVAVLGVGLVVALLLVGLAVYVGVRRAAREREVLDSAERQGATLLFATQFAVGAGFFVFLGQDMQQRYTMYGLVFGGLLVGVAVVAAWERVGPLLAGRSVAVLAVLALLPLGWLATQGWTVRAAQAHQTDLYGPDAAAGRLVRALDGGHPCVLLGGLAQPQTQIYTSCKSVRRKVTAELALTAVTSPTGRELSVFALSKVRDATLADLGPGWSRMTVHLGAGTPMVLTYHLAGQGSSPQP
jgi:hypothetical protein